MACPEPKSTDGFTCGFEYSGKSCVLVCSCHSVYECFDDCSPYAPSLISPLTKISSYLKTGDYIQAYTFNFIVSLYNDAVNRLKIPLTLSKSYTAGTEIAKTDLDPIFSYYESASTTSGVSNCSFESLPITLSNFVRPGGIIYASDWNNVIKHMQLLSTCCRCVGNSVYSCLEVCDCLCFY